MWRRWNGRPSLLAKLGAGGAILAALAAAGVLFILVHGQAKPLGLAPPVSRTPAPSPSPDDPLALACRQPPAQGSQASGVGGLWTIQPGSVAGYRAHEKFAELTSPHVAVARTNRLRGWILVGASQGVRIEAGCIAVDVSSLQSADELPGFNTSDRDKSAREMLETAAHPYVIFQPYAAAFQLDPNSESVQHVKVSGDLQISGVTQPATFALDVRLQSAQLAAAGQTTVFVNDY